MTMKMLIVDDEQRIRLGLQAMIEGMGLPIEIIGLCAHGIQALDKMSAWEAGDCKVLLTDIKMPMMDGMKLIEKTRAEYPDAHIILLSGFNEFEYARQAIRFGVEEYLSKPVNKKELFQVLKRVGERLSVPVPDAKESTDHMPAEPKVHKKQIIADVIRMLESDLNQAFELNELSAKVGLNPSYLCKLFKRETNKTITDYVTDLRMVKAKHILEDHPDVKMYEVGSLVGYSDPVYFTKLFKKSVGMTPKEYQSGQCAFGNHNACLD
ncbi:response regulator [Paenibacillus qinlingensis]|uniref:YesN/AraC family two-component response regulator n=1 Tax=Paenibacillus qinlingensis TaxID=1837343 RepID=A0ABU1NUK0_9BACL|nr:response regulator [Paenibacillus qinlingensis]MDR6551154.1 YesN/AraC family two-component response regulator [Paenibacillus qinlingensis]